jgi:hypothetical protein
MVGNHDMVFVWDQFIIYGNNKSEDYLGELAGNKCKNTIGFIIVRVYIL